MGGIGSVAVIGTGKMGEIMGAGFVSAGLDPASVRVSDMNSELAGTVARRHRFTLCASNIEAVEGAAVVLVAVKPPTVPAVLEELNSALAQSQLILSIAAGVTTATLETALQKDHAVVRAMPNVASQVGAGITAICPGSHAGEEHLAQAEQLLGGVGPVLRVAEGLMDAVTAVSGSGPAYFALVAEAMTDAAVTAGLPRSTASQLVAQTMLGAARMLTDARLSPASLREAVMSPAGTTAMGVRELERSGVRGAILDAVQAAMDRSAALAGPSDKGG